MQSLLTPQQVASILTISYRKVLELIIMGSLAAFKIGNAYRIHPSDVRQFLENNKYNSLWK